MPSRSHKTISVSSSGQNQLIDITSEVADFVSKSGVTSGVCHVYVPHTTAAVTINENADPDVVTDIIKGLNHIVPSNLGYDHSEGNSPAHIKSSIIGATESVFVEGGRLVLGTWQGIYFCEFDGPRSRKAHLKIVEAKERSGYMIQHQIELRVRYQETDQMGVVYYSNYLVWFETARTELFRAKGLVYKQLEDEDKIFLPVVEAYCRYRSPVRYDDLVKVIVKLTDMGKSRLTFEYEVKVGEKLTTSGETKHVFIDEKGKAVTIPEKVRKAFL